MTEYKFPGKKMEVEAEIKRLTGRIGRHIRSALVLAGSEMPNADEMVIFMLDEIKRFCEQRRALRTPK